MEVTSITKNMVIIRDTDWIIQKATKKRTYYPLEQTKDVNL